MIQKKALYFTLDEIAQLAQQALKEAFGREIQVRIVINDESYWNIAFQKNSVTREEEFKMLDFFDADDSDRRETARFYVESPRAAFASDLTMSLSRKVIRTRIPLRQIYSDMIDENEKGIWIIGD